MGVSGQLQPPLTTAEVVPALHGRTVDVVREPDQINVPGFDTYYSVGNCRNLAAEAEFLRGTCATVRTRDQMHRAYRVPVEPWSATA